MYSTDRSGLSAVCVFRTEHEAQAEIRLYTDGPKRYAPVKASAKAIKQCEGELNTLYIPEAARVRRKAAK